MGEIKTCFFCNEEANYKSIGALNQLFQIDCPNCGSFRVSSELLTLGDIKKYAPYKHLISGVIREKNDLGLLIETITIENIMSIVSDPRVPKSIMQKLDKILIHYYRKNKVYGETFQIDDRTPYSIGYAQNYNELFEMAITLKEYGILNSNIFLNRSMQFTLTLDGLTRAEELFSIQVQSNKVFVAMGFKEDLLKAHEKAIQPACDECGFDAMLIIDAEHNDDITDRIIAEIKTSKFMITDFTYNNHGAYFEAGYAQGRGLEVIRTCKKEWFDEKDENDNTINHLHFDINHYNFILWEDYEDLKEKLVNRIRATIL